MSSAPEAGTEIASGKLALDEPAAGVLRLTISNERKRGALDHELLDALRDTVSSADARCLLLTGRGSVFSAGYDIGNFDEDSFAEAAESLVAHPFTEAMDALAAYRYPVVCAINGHAIGGGLELAITCDMRLVARGAKLGMPPAKIGLIYSHTGLQRFIDVCGVANTNELFLLGRNVDADRAREMGLVNWVVSEDELERQSLEIAAELAANAPLSTAGDKEIIRKLRTLGPDLPPDVERELVELRESCFSSEDFREGIRSFAEKRPPEWRNR